MYTAAMAADPTITPETMQDIAIKRPDLRGALATNPSLYPDLRNWLAQAMAQAAGQQGPGGQYAPATQFSSNGPAGNGTAQAGPAPQEPGAAQGWSGGQGGYAPDGSAQAGGQGGYAQGGFGQGAGQGGYAPGGFGQGAGQGGYAPGGFAQAGGQAGYPQGAGAQGAYGAGGPGMVGAPYPAPKNRSKAILWIAIAAVVAVVAAGAGIFAFARMSGGPKDYDLATGWNNGGQQAWTLNLSGLFSTGSSVATAFQPVVAVKGNRMVLLGVENGTFTAKGFDVAGDQPEQKWAQPVQGGEKALSSYEDPTVRWIGKDHVLVEMGRASVPVLIAAKDGEQTPLTWYDASDENSAVVDAPQGPGEVVSVQCSVSEGDKWKSSTETHPTCTLYSKTGEQTTAKIAEGATSKFWILSLRDKALYPLQTDVEPSRTAGWLASVIVGDKDPLEGKGFAKDTSTFDYYDVQGQLKGTVDVGTGMPMPCGNGTRSSNNFSKLFYDALEGKLTDTVLVLEYSDSLRFTGMHIGADTTNRFGEDMQKLANLGSRANASQTGCVASGDGKALAIVALGVEVEAGILEPVLAGDGITAIIDPAAHTLKPVSEIPGVSAPPASYALLARSDLIVTVDDSTVTAFKPAK